MSHDVYICYDEKDKEVLDSVYNVFEQNSIKTWFKSRDFSKKDSVDKITNAIENSKCFVLIYSENTKDANYIVTETDIAFSRNIPIFVFNIDDSKLSRNLQFILETQPMINAFPNPKNQLKEFVRETSKIMGRPINDVKIDSKYLNVFKRINPRKNEDTVKKYVKIAIPIIVALVLIYLFVIVPTGQHTTDNGVFAMNITDVDVSESDGVYKYTVYGESYNMPSDSDKYFMNIRFLDNDDKLAFEINSTADEFKSGVIGSCELDDNNINHIAFKLTDVNGNVISKENYEVK